VCLGRSPPADISISPFSRQRRRRASYKSASFLLNDPFYQKSAQPILYLSCSLERVYFTRSCLYHGNGWNGKKVTSERSRAHQLLRSLGSLGFLHDSITLLIETATLKRTR